VYPSITFLRVRAVGCVHVYDSAMSTQRIDDFSYLYLESRRNSGILFRHHNDSGMWEFSFERKSSLYSRFEYSCGVNGDTVRGCSEPEP
jgi:hypothetical protein